MASGFRAALDCCAFVVTTVVCYRLCFPEPVRVVPASQPTVVVLKEEDVLESTEGPARLPLLAVASGRMDR